MGGAGHIPEERVGGVGHITLRESGWGWTHNPEGEWVGLGHTSDGGATDAVLFLGRVYASILKLLDNQLHLRKLVFLLVPAVPICTQCQRVQHEELQG